MDGPQWGFLAWARAAGFVHCALWYANGLCCTAHSSGLLIGKGYTTSLSRGDGLLASTRLTAPSGSGKGMTSKCRDALDDVSALWQAATYQLHDLELGLLAAV